MTYLDILEIFEAAARTVDPNATYYRGRISDVSLASHTAETNIIYVLDTTQVTPDTESVFETWRVRIGFFRQDSTSSESMEVNQQQTGEESRETIFSETLILARKFYSALENENTLQLTGTARYSQLTRELQGTFTGWGLDVDFLLEIGCEFETTIPDAVYRNAETDPSFQVSIKRGENYTAPQITVTDSDGTTFEQDANTDVVCTQSGTPATAVLKNSAGTTISTTSIDPGTSEDIPAPDATAVLKNTLGATLLTEAIPSNVIEDITAPNGTANVQDQDDNPLGSDNAIPSGGSKTVTVTVPKTWTVEITFQDTNDTYIITPFRDGDIAAQVFSGASTDATYGGDNFAAWDKILTSAVPITIVRNSAVATETLTLTGTYD